MKTKAEGGSIFSGPYKSISALHDSDAEPILALCLGSLAANFLDGIRISQQPETKNHLLFGYFVSGNAKK